jgi:hypothetical protein
MVYCVVYNCFTSSNADKNVSNGNADKSVSFFSFPKDEARKDLWVQYCQRRDFVVTKHSKICSKHFTSSQYLRLPSRLAELGYTNARALLKEDAVPDVPWRTDKESVEQNKKNKPTSHGGCRSIRKRKLEVITRLNYLFV